MNVGALAVALRLPTGIVGHCRGFGPTEHKTICRSLGFQGWESEAERETGMREERDQEPFLTPRSSSRILRTCQDHDERRKVASSTTP